MECRSHALAPTPPEQKQPLPRAARTVAPAVSSAVSHCAPAAVVRGHVVCNPSAPPQGSSSSLFEVFQTCENLYYASWTQVTSLERLQLPVVSVFTPVYSNVHSRPRGQTVRTRAKIMSSDVTCGLTVAEVV